ncbi:MAG: hypothetical protein ACI8QZ_002710, partial [Chlamydiales bacterium]
MLLRVAILATILIPSTALGQASLRSLPKAALAGWNSRPLDASARVAGPAPLHSVVDSLPR